MSVVQQTSFFDLFRPTRKQFEFLKAVLLHRYVLYGGARGGGKSMGIRWILLYLHFMWAQMGIRNVSTGLFCETYRVLEDRQINKIKKEFPAYIGEVRKRQGDGLGFHIRPEYGGGTIMLRNLDDATKYQSAEFAAVAVDELTKHPVTVFDELRGSLRWPGVERPVFMAATNPGGVGHLWVRTLWIDREFEGDYERYAKIKDEFKFIQSLPSDNPHLTEDYYENELGTLTYALRQAWQYGNWDIFEGMAFEEFDRRIHMTDWKPEADAWNIRWSATGDWGFTNPGALYLMATTPERSLARIEHKFSKQNPELVGFEWAKLLARLGMPRPEYMFLDQPPIPDGQQSIVERFQMGVRRGTPKGEKPFPIIPMYRSPGSRYAKKQLFHEHLRWWDQEKDERLEPSAFPQLLLHESCRYAQRTLPALPLAEHDPEDVDTDSEDHAYDALAGWILGRTPRVARKKLEGKIEANRHPGYDAHGRVKTRVVDEWDGQREHAWSAEERAWSREPYDWKRG